MRIGQQAVLIKNTSGVNIVKGYVFYKKTSAMNGLRVAGRIIFGLIMVAFGIMHLMNAKQMAGMIPSAIPGGIFWIYFTAFAYMAAAISFFINRITFWSGILLAILLLVITFTIELPMVLNPKTMSEGLIGILKNFGLVAGLLFIAADHRVAKK